MENSIPISIFADFDGTICPQDTLVCLLDKFGAPDWRNIEMKLESGELAEKDALKYEIDTINASWRQAISFLKEVVVIDPAFKDFIKWIRAKNINFTILSGGFIQISRELLSHHSLGDLEIRANLLEIEEGKWKIIPANRPRIKDLCNHCKTSSVVEAQQAGNRVIYIGDGTTDRCPATKADVIFAKDKLQSYCQENDIDYIPFNDFSDIIDHLEYSRLIMKLQGKNSQCVI